MRALFISSVCCLLAGNAGAQVPAPSIEDLALLPAGALTEALTRLRDAEGGLSTLRELELAASSRAEGRRASGQPPQSAGCLRTDEFDLDSHLKLARQAASGAEFSVAARQYREATRKLDAKLADARRRNEWRKHFPSLNRWEREWRDAAEPRTRELLLRTLSGQAIRAALGAERVKSPRRMSGSPRAAGVARPRAAPRKDGAELTRGAYREYVFNLMCAEDEENLHWFKQQLAEIGWFGMRKYGWAADRAALLIVQHADADPMFQSSVAQQLEPRITSGDTDPENFAYLIDRVAVRAGRPQRFGTQMECVAGAWVVPRIEALESLDARRARMNLVAYDVQLARTRGLCRD